jgi:CRISPR-associated protein Cas2
MSGTARQRYVVTYDICDPERLRKVFRVMKGFGRHLQLSVFVCDLSALNLAKLKAELVAIVHVTEDQVLIVDVGPTDGRGIEVFEAIGRPYQERALEARIL